MIAVYYYDNDTPFQMYVLKLTDEPGEHHKFLEELENIHLEWCIIIIIINCNHFLSQRSNTLDRSSRSFLTLRLFR